MLVLQRKLDERIFINGGEIIITIASVRGNVVRLGFEAAPHIRIDREEVHDDVTRAGYDRRDRGGDMDQGGNHVRGDC